MSNATIYKYPIDSVCVLNLPSSAEPLKVAMQDERPVMWVKLNPEELTVRRRFEIYGTGHTIPDAEGRHYVDTLFAGSLVFHVFEVTS